MSAIEAMLYHPTLISCNSAFGESHVASMSHWNEANSIFPRQSPKNLAVYPREIPCELRTGRLGIRDSGLVVINEDGGA